MLTNTELIANSGFEDGTLSPWRAGGSLLPQLETWARHQGRYAALIGRTTAGAAVTSTLALSITIPSRVITATLALHTEQRCTTLRPRSQLRVEVLQQQRRGQTETLLLNGCGRDKGWLPLTTNLSRAIGGTAVITAIVGVAPHEAAALLLDDVTITTTALFTPTSGFTGTLTDTVPATATPSITATGTITATPAISGTPSATATSTDVPNICVSSVISAAYQLELPTFTPTPMSRPARAPVPTATGTIQPTPTRPWWHTVTPTATATPTGSPSPTPGYTMTPGPSPTIGTDCHPVTKGISYDFVAHDGGVASAATAVVGTGEINDLLNAGARAVRLDVHLVHDNTWSSAEYAAYDDAINAFNNAHIDIMGLVGPGAVSLDYQPNAWLANSFERQGGNGDNGFLHSYAARVLDLVGHFHGRIKAWELWNEPNVGRAGMSGTYMYPSNFAAMLADTYALVKASYPDVTLVSGGILSDDDAGHSNQVNAGADYLRQTYYMGLQVTHTWDPIQSEFHGTPLDAIGQHLYLDQGGIVYTRHVVDAFQWMHDAYAAFGDGAKPIFMTEGAWSTSPVSQATQALNLDMLYSIAENPVVPYVTRVYWYLLRDGHDPGQTYGLESSDGSPKQAYYHYQTY